MIIKETELNRIIRTQQLLAKHHHNIRSKNKPKKGLDKKFHEWKLKIFRLDTIVTTAVYNLFNLR